MCCDARRFKCKSCRGKCARVIYIIVWWIAQCAILQMVNISATQPTQYATSIMYIYTTIWTNTPAIQYSTDDCIHQELFLYTSTCVVHKFLYILYSYARTYTFAYSYIYGGEITFCCRLNVCQTTFTQRLYQDEFGVAGARCM